ncbi:MAG: hypothetical protein ACLQF4_03025 [Xanthobacteraceae bacterium]
MTLSNAERQQRWRDKRNALAREAIKLRQRLDGGAQHKAPLRNDRANDGLAAKDREIATLKKELAQAKARITKLEKKPQRAKKRKPAKWKTSYRVKYQPAQTVYIVQCHDMITLTMPYGHPPDQPGFEHADRRDRPACWQLWCHERAQDGSGTSWVVSEHATKEEARAALLEARRTKEAASPVPRSAHAQN